MDLKIVPFTLKQFSEYFKYMFANNKNTPKTFLEMFEICFESKENREGPQWKKAIEDIIISAVK